ncbi:hypothetical protein MJI69_31175, partial [Salmonella enterica subsp. enterica serovar Anatum]|nr:hypothetical protein [Salmonella enterica subsp. enterica serovar Anatum]
RQCAAFVSGVVKDAFSLWLNQNVQAAEQLAEMAIASAQRRLRDEKIGQLRLISVGPDNPKEAIREMIKDGQVGAIFNTVTRQDI